ncbi:hypothetical protein PGB90_010518 [Kerria lacca]
MNDVINSKSTCEFMAASIVRVLLICTTSVIIKLIAAQDFIFETASVEIGLQFDSEPEDIIAIHGKRAELSCSVSTPLKGRLSIHWTRNNVKISNTKRKYVIGKKKNNQTDAGTYCCVATVNVGASSAVLISKPAVVKIAVTGRLLIALSSTDSLPFSISFHRVEVLLPSILNDSVNDTPNLE